MKRTKHVLWRVGNGWIRTVSDGQWLGNSSERESIFVFKNLRQFSDWFEQESKLDEKPEANQKLKAIK